VSKDDSTVVKPPSALSHWPLSRRVKRTCVTRWSQLPCGQKRGSSAVRLLGLRARVPPGAWMSVSCECCVLSGIGLCVGLITRPEEFYRMGGMSEGDREAWIKRRPWPTRGCRAIGDKVTRTHAHTHPPAQLFFSDCLTPKVHTSHSFKTSVITYQSTRHIPEEFNLEQPHYETFSPASMKSFQFSWVHNWNGHAMCTKHRLLKIITVTKTQEYSK
jgi:hypothetical protein